MLHVNVSLLKRLKNFTGLSWKVLLVERLLVARLLKAINLFVRLSLLEALLRLAVRFIVLSLKVLLEDLLRLVKLLREIRPPMKLIVVNGRLKS